MGSNYDCPVCLETVTPLCNKILLVSSQCGHFICDKCADTQLMNVGTNQCAICRTNVTRKSYTPYSVDNALYNSYYEVRRKINQIFNSTRANFANTPLYDAYLEQREDLIYELAECETDAKRSKIEQQIRNYQRENARLIEENNTLQKIQHKKQVIDIVKTEDIFYEIVANRCLFKNEPPSLIHPLQRTYSDYFIIDQVKLSAEVEPQPLNGNIKQDTDIVRARYGTLKQLIESDVAGGFNQKLLEFTCREKFESLVFITQPQ
ncbi:CDK-activating kinase assembly factor MAT1 [Babesia microti strain RI]|uniref:CDK-activating kinase assembly factor MAT1 n=1 Tax=Babesia microti (strain RI) TaxID=1133968 RepID=A0A1N6LX53_BABMR|nr:CDK-activating kinase assembly factor MAT1 [Babesia microti strain RI]SIO73441.1 CDK-activating kinase assembly factor MAT1 [Babesia microti strain RI]|eukprot:XP_021337539.1 CDK-activating kinase assembly factor MAT1 [Babesia microti strain RI]